MLTYSEERICRPADWKDVVKFFLLNYVLHIFTLVYEPGIKQYSVLINTAYALLMPSSGLFRAITIITICPAWQARSDGLDGLQVAHASGALYTVVNEEKFNGNILNPADAARLRPMNGINVHGQHEEGAGYRLFRIPLHWKVGAATTWSRSQHLQSYADNSGLLSSGKPMSRYRVSNNYSLVKVGAAMMQITYASYQLYYARGRQLQTFGYAAYGLTVIPYALMSFMNLIAALMSPQYPFAYLVQHGEDWGTAPASSMNAAMDGTVGQFWRTGSVRTSRDNWRISIRIVILVILSLVPFLAVQFFTGFEKQESTLAQRVWLIGWMVLGQASGLFLGLSSALDYFWGSSRSQSGSRRLLLATIPAAVWAIGGLVVVGKTILSFGVCERVG